MKRLSLRLRLLLLFTLALLSVWIAASVLAWREIDDEVEEILDAQLIAFADHLGRIDVTALLEKEHGSPAAQQPGKEIAVFAVFDSAGKLSFNEGLYGLVDIRAGEPANRGEKNRPRNQGRWRMLWVTDRSGHYRIAVAQHLGYRDELALEVIESQFTPWLIMFPFFLLAVSILLKREFRPMKDAADALTRRRPDDAAPVDPGRLPREIRPFIHALNALFVRVSELLLRERRFTSDAAHELRSPLAGLRVQAEVAQMAKDDLEARTHALEKLTLGIDRTSRLIDQMLALSRLDSLGSLSEIESIDWCALLQEAIDGFRERAEKRRIAFCLDCAGTPAAMQGQKLLLMLLFRNLLENALHHSFPGGCVKVRLEAGKICVEDEGPGVLPSNLPRLGERFFRLAGQSEAGTGLGLSIVKRIADLHGIEVVFANRLEGGLRVELHL